MFFGLPDPSIIKQISEKNLDFYCFVTASEFCLNCFFFGVLNVNDENSRIRIRIRQSGFISQRHGSVDPDPDLHQNAMGPEHWLRGRWHKIFAYAFNISYLPILHVFAYFFGLIGQLYNTCNIWRD
jgi:hypothetical protein